MYFIVLRFLVFHCIISFIVTYSLCVLCIMLSCLSCFNIFFNFTSSLASLFQFHNVYLSHLSFYHYHDFFSVIASCLCLSWFPGSCGFMSSMYHIFQSIVFSLFCVFHISHLSQYHFFIGIFV